MKESAGIKIRTKAGLITLITVALIALSLMIANLVKIAAPIGRDLVAASTPSTTPIYGWCVKLKQAMGAHMSSDSCYKSVWYMWCADIPGEQPRNERNCGCKSNPPGEKSLLLQGIIDGRDSLISNSNDGNITSQDTDDLKEFLIAFDLECVCDIFSSGNRPADDPLTEKVDESLTTLIEGPLGIKGNFDLISKAAIMFSKIGKMPNCGVLPPGCSVSNNYQLSSPDNPTSAHVTGQAFDICCGSTGTAGDTCANADKLQVIIDGAQSAGLSTIRECTAKEQGKATDPQHCDKPNGTKSCPGGLVHIQDKGTQFNQKDCISQ